MAAVFGVCGLSVAVVIRGGSVGRLCVVAIASMTWQFGQAVVMRRDCVTWLARIGMKGSERQGEGKMRGMGQVLTGREEGEKRRDGMCL